MGFKGYITQNGLKELDGKICVWGTGIDAEAITRLKPEHILIDFYLDSNRSGHEFLGKRIFSYEEYKQFDESLPIVIATYRFAVEIAKEIDESFDYYIWDEQGIFQADENVKRFIDFNNKNWGNKKRVGESQVLIPFDNRHAIRPIVHAAFLGNYFAEKYDAKIYGYFRFGGKKENASEVLMDVYKSINMVDVIDFNLTQGQKSEADRIWNEIWPRLKNWSDWKKIKIYDVEIGTTFIRHYLRHYMVTFNNRDESCKRFIKDAIDTFLFWYDYLNEHDVKVIMLADGVCWDGYIRDIAAHLDIPTYTSDTYFQRVSLNYNRGRHYPFFDAFWEQLTENEKTFGIQWAKEELDKRVNGKTDYLTTSNDLNVYAQHSTTRATENDQKTKILICPHIFEEDSYWCGEQIFDNNYLVWLKHIGELAKDNQQYGWYLKIHPSASKRDLMIMDEYLKEYPEIHKVDKMISPIQLRREGVKWALTVCGTIAQEYPLIGIQVINAGKNPGERFDFAWNPKSKEEFDKLITNLDKVEPKEDFEEIYKFYALNVLYYKRREYHDSNIFFDDVRLEWDRPTLLRNGLDYGTWQYEQYLKEWTAEKHQRTLQRIPELIKELDEWKPDCFYR
jgi:hypothetical protein